MALLAQSFRATLPQTNNQLRTSSITQNQATIQDGNGGAQNRAENANAGQGKPVKCYNCNGSGHIAWNSLDEEELLFLDGKQANTFDAYVDNQPVEDLALNEDNIFQADECDAFDSDVDDEPTAQSIFMANLSSAGPANPQAGPSNASILSEVHILENAIDHSVTNQDEHEIHYEVQQANVIKTTSVDMGNSNVIPYEQYLSVDNIFVVPSCASFALNDVCVSSDNDVFVPHDPIATELKIYKEQVAIYEQRAKFELTEREQRMDDQMRMLIQNRNKTEENLKKELHSVKLQLNSTMENNKIIEETVTTLKQEFKHKESKFLTDFFNLKHLNDKLENKLHSQDQSIQTIHMMLNPTQVYDQKTKTALSAQNPFYLRQAKKAQSELYDGEELLKTHHVPVIVLSSEEDLELAETTRNKLHAKINDSTCVEKRVEELKVNAPPLPVLPPATVYPPNIPVHLVPRTLPTTSQVNIGLYVITQLFWDFEKTCKKRITPTGITEGERGFEQTKRCYLTKVIPFFNLLKEHFDGVQKSLVTEVRAMKAVYENLEAEVDQNEIDLMSGEIEQKNLLITNENLIAECLSKYVFYTATDSVLNKNSDADPIFDLKALVSQNKDLTAKLNALHDLNKRFRTENAKVKHHYKELYDSIKITRAKTTDQNNSLLSEIENLEAQLKDNSKGVTIPDSKPKVLASGRYPIDELLEYVIVMCPKDFSPRDKQNAPTTSLRKKRVTFVEPCETLTHNTPAQVEHQKINSTNALGIPSTRVKGASIACKSKSRSNTKKDRTLPAKSALKQVEAHFRMNKSNEKQKNHVDSSISYKRIWPLTRNTPPTVLPTKQWKPTGRLLPLGRQCTLVRSTALKSDYLDGVDLIKGSRGTNLYTISVEDMMRSSPICLLSKASKNKSWLWHRRLNHLNFGTLNDLARKDLVRGLPRLKFEKDHLCSACQLGKSRKATHKPKTINTIMEVLHTLHMDLCGPLRVQSINGKKYILVIVDDYSRFTWVKFLRSKDETPAFVINLLKQLQVGLNKTVRFVRTDNGTEFVNKALTDYYESVGITHEKTVPRTPQQNGVVERRNRTLVEAARTMLIFSKAPLFLWAEAVATACYTQNRSLIHTLHDKTPYELVHDKKLDL
ncbi:retrovirus-related pol polyprotein from transposon TNT 1-94 [Tanacetum coccineum]